MTKVFIIIIIITIITASILQVNGLPRPALRTGSIAGAPTNYSLPDVFSIGLGGGSRVERVGEGEGGDGGGQSGGRRWRVGPLSVGNELMSRWV